jgi:hypothetical protein
MRFILTIPSLLCLASLLGQQRVNYIEPDTCSKIEQSSGILYVGKKQHQQPLFIANGIVAGGGQYLDASLIDTIYVLRCPEAFYQYSYAGVNGVVVMQTRQVFETVPLTSIRKKMRVEGPVIYAINGYPLTDSTLYISTKAVEEIEGIASKGIVGSDRSTAVINIWTLSKKERKSVRLPLLINNCFKKG